MFNRSNVDSSDEESSDHGSDRSSSPSVQTSRATPADSWHDVKSDNEARLSERSGPTVDPVSQRNQTNNLSRRSSSDQSQSDDDEELSHQRNTLSTHSSIQSDSKPSINIRRESNEEPRDVLLKQRISSERSSLSQSDSEQQTNKSRSIDSTHRIDTKPLQLNTIAVNSKTSIDDIRQGDSFLTQNTSMQSGPSSSVSSLQRQDSAGDHHQPSLLQDDRPTLLTANGVDQFTNYPTPLSNPLVNSAFPEKKMIPPSSNESQRLTEERISSLLPLQSISGNNQSISSTAITTDWTNPYWKDQHAGSTGITTGGKDARSLSQVDQPWENPSLKDKAPVQSMTPLDQITNENPSRLPTAPKSDQPWENPYWKDKAQSNSAATSRQTTSQNLSTSSAVPKLDQPWENPYWKDKKSASSDVTAGQTTSQSIRQPPTAPKSDQPWENPYWKDKSTPNTTALASTALTSQTGQGWVNPYWKDQQPQKSSTPAPPATTTDTKWQNPYWKDTKPQTGLVTSNNAHPAISMSSSNNPREGTSQQSKPWVNPYWGTTHSTNSQPPPTSMPSKQQDKPWVNPYWKDSKTPDIPKEKSSSSFTFAKNDISSKRRQSDSTNGAGLQNGGRDSPTESNAPPIPSFFQRIFPSPTSSSVSKPAKIVKSESTNTKQAPPPSSSNQYHKLNTSLESDDEPLPFTVDGRGILHFLKDQFFSSTSKLQSSAPPAPSSPPRISSSQYNNPSVSSADYSQPQPLAAPPANSVPIQGISATTPLPTAVPTGPPSAASKLLPSVSFINKLASSPRAVVITEAEINDIQKALQTLEKNPNAIPVIETSPKVNPQPNPNSNTNGNTPYTALNNLWTKPPQPSSHQTIPPTTTPQYTTHNPPNISSLMTMNPSQSKTNSSDRFAQPKHFVHI